VSTSPLIPGWPGTPSAIVFSLDGASVRQVLEIGDVQAVRPWASVSKMATALALGVENDWGQHTYDQIMGPPGATMATILSHASGLGFEKDDPTVNVGEKRIYSNYGVDLVVEKVCGENSPAEWLNQRVFTPLGMNTTKLVGRPSAGVEGSTTDLARLALAWLRPDAISLDTRNRAIRPYAPTLRGITPGFGSFTPNLWGLGPEIQGEKHHWMGDWPAESFGHFGQSGALLLANAQEKIAVVATSTESFGSWAVALWPQWVSDMRQLALDSRA
jgi:Beta-lactamase